MASSKRLHVVAVPLCAQGHLNPLMRFCKLLAAQGVLVTFVNIDPVHYRIEQLQQEEEEEEERGKHKGNGDLCVESNIRRAHIPIHGLDLTNDFRVSLEPFFEAQNTIVPPLEALILELNQQGPPVTCIISDVTMTIPTQNVADKLNIPRVMFFPSSASTLLLSHYVMQGEHTSLQKVLASLTRRALKEVVLDGVPGLPTIYKEEILCFKHIRDDSAFMWGFMMRVCEIAFGKAHAIVINSLEDLEGPSLKTLSTISSFPIYGVGPLVEPLHKESSTSLWKENKECILWLDQQPPLSVLYISFGSVTLLTETQLEEILSGLVSSNQLFLWVFRPDLVENVAYSTFVPNIISRSHGKGFVVDWAPQLQVLSHPSVGGFLTHCGWNSTVEAISHGVPMLCWPYVADQFLDAKYIVEEWKVGLKFEASKENNGLVERCEVERVIKALMEGKQGEILRENAIGLKEACYQSLLPGASSERNIKSLIKTLM